MEQMSIIGIVITFVVAAIVLSVGITILDSVSSGFDCKDLAGYDATGSTDTLKYPSGTWAGQCMAVQDEHGALFLIQIIVGVLSVSAILLVVYRHFIT